MQNGRVPNGKVVPCDVMDKASSCKYNNFIARMRGGVGYFIPKSLALEEIDDSGALDIPKDKDEGTKVRSIIL